MSELDIQGAVIVDVDLDAEVPCQEAAPCNRPAEWGQPRLACGHAAFLVCDELRAAFLADPADDVGCPRCGHVEPEAPWLARWWRL